ncbi:MAG TPA: hypothetical protein VK659_04790, partial [Asanoa sp.]|nr:hypothetical protein [Asanoa sp.]
EPDNPVSISTEMPAMTGCNGIEFDPSLEARPTTNAADSPTGLHVDLNVPQNEDELGRRVADLRDVKVTLPPGLVINPAGANGLESCSAADFDLHGPGAGHCPDASKVGTAEVDTPLMNHTLPGAVYIAKPYDNPFNSLLAIYVEVNDPISGVIIKLPGRVEPDPNTGQLTTSFDENPQLPFSHFRLDFFKGAKAPLRTSPVCGTYQTKSVLTPWSAPESGPPAQWTDSFPISQSPAGGCPGSADTVPNKPVFEAGTASPLAGAYSPFVVHLRREDGTQEFQSLTVSPPPGLLAKLAGTDYCPEANLGAAASRPGSDEAASPSCPPSSEVGTVNVGAGAGPSPYYVQGHAYLAGPYKGAPLSLAVVTPAAAGPYDLGTVVVRVALLVDPETTKITAVSDPLPHILKGIPLDIRSIALQLGKPEFTLNPTSCNPAALTAQLGSTLGNVAQLSNPFQVGNCTNLGFKPKLSTRIFGPTMRSGNPRLQAVLTMPAGGANIGKAVVTLPHSEFLDQSHIRTICTRVQYAANNCPSAAIYGFAKAWSPLLAQPLEGPVYLRSSNHNLPDLVASLNGQIHVDLVGRIDSKNGGIRTSFETVPDAPVSKFQLTMQGGKKGLLENSTDVCSGKHTSVAQFDAQSGATEGLRPQLINPKCKGKKPAGRKRSAGKKKR